MYLYILLILIVIICGFVLLKPLKEGHKVCNKDNTNTSKNNTSNNTSNNTTCNFDNINSCKSNTIGSSKIQGEKGTLFLYPETGGFDNLDFGGFPSPEVVKSNFHTIAVVGNHAAGDSGLKNIFYHPKVLQLQKETNLPLVNWMAYYFGYDSEMFCYCNIKGCELLGKCSNPAYTDKKTCEKNGGTWTWPPQDCEKCKVALCSEVMKNIKEYNLVGILFDDEVGDPSCIVDSMEYVKSKCPSLQLGWTKSLGNAKQTSPDNLGKMNWDICLGQAYTDTTTNLYNGSCKFADDFWNQIIQTKYDSTTDANRGVPMICGGGNCQEIDGCIDERMNTSTIDDVLNKRPDSKTFKWRNFGIWYGTYANPSNCNTDSKSPDYYKCCTVNGDDSKCKTSCCNQWVMK